MTQSVLAFLRGRRFVPLLLLTCLFLPFAGPQQSAGSNRRDEEADIREAVLRKQMWDWIRGSQEDGAKAKSATEKDVANGLNFKTFFVSINGKDPPDDFIKRFRNVPRIVKRVSASTTKDWRNTVVDKATGQTGIVFRADSVHWKSENSVEVDGGYFCDGLCGTWVTFRLVRKNGKWIVNSWIMRRIS